MSKARLVITAVVTEGRSQGEVARAYGVSQGWVSRLVGRYRAEGEAAFEPRSRRPRTSPTAVSADTADLIITLRKDLAGQGLDAAPQTIAWHLQHHHHIRVASATISRYLARAGLVTPDPAKRPRNLRLPPGCQRKAFGFTHYLLRTGRTRRLAMTTPGMRCGSPPTAGPAARPWWPSSALRSLPTASRPRR
jgi:transposase